MTNKKYVYNIVTTFGFPMDTVQVNEWGADGWRLTGVVRTTTLVAPVPEGTVPYEAESFWYYFVKEVADENV